MEVLDARITNGAAEGSSLASPESNVASQDDGMQEHVRPVERDQS